MCRYYRNDNGIEAEVCVYRDKWWTKSGGTVHADLYCLVDDVQQALGGRKQSWLNPDYDLPLEHFQYGLGKSAIDLSQEIRSSEDAEQFAQALLRFLHETGLAWFAQFELPDGITSYLLDEERLHALARYRAHLGDQAGARAAVNQYLKNLPRQNEQELDTLVSAGLLEDEDRRFLASAALQAQTEYESRIDKWLASQSKVNK